jgi:hypothetical protein
MDTERASDASTSTAGDDGLRDTELNHGSFNSISSESYGSDGKVGLEPGNGMRGGATKEAEVGVPEPEPPNPDDPGPPPDGGRCLEQNLESLAVFGTTF